MHSYLTLLFLSLWALPSLSGANSRTDSLQRVVEDPDIHWKERGDALASLMEVYFSRDSGKVFNFGRKGLRLAHIHNSDSSVSNFHNMMAIGYYTWGVYEKALAHYDSTLFYNQKLGKKEWTATAINNKGLVYLRMANYDKALLSFHKAMEMKRKWGDSLDIALIRDHIGLVHKNMGSYQKAMKNYLRSATILEGVLNSDTLDDAETERVSDYLGDVYNNLGNLHLRAGSFQKGRSFLFKSLEEFKRRSDSAGIGTTFLNIGNLFLQKGSVDSAIAYFEKGKPYINKFGNPDAKASLAIQWGTALNRKGNDIEALEKFQRGDLIYQKTKQPRGRINALLSIGKLYYEHERYDQALRHVMKAKGITDTMDLLPDEAKVNGLLGKIHAGKGDFEKAIAYRKKEGTIQDSLMSLKTKEKLKELEEKYQARKTQLKIQNQKKTNKLQKEKLEKEALVSSVLMVGSGMLGLAGIMLFLGYRRKKKANELLGERNTEIKEKRDLIEEKNQDITDSIQYAKRLQTNLLPDLEEQLGKESCFAFYRPKDIVSGDFYWYGEREGKRVLTVGDCTGHGVPGAMVSLVAFDGLYRAVHESGVLDPADILRFLNDSVRNVFGRSTERTRTDGLDIAVLVIDDEAQKVWSSGAKNAVYHVRSAGKEELQLPSGMIGRVKKEEEHGKRCTRIQGDRIGVGEVPDPDFTTVEFDHMKGDLIYLSSDGFPDQFGGSKGKKFKDSNLRKAFLQIADKSMVEQKTALETTFDEWRGEMEQVDDVCVVGITT